MKRQILYDFTYRGTQGSQIHQIHRDRKSNGGCQGLGGGRMGSCYLMSSEFHVYKTDRVLEIDNGEVDDDCTIM